MRLDLTAQGIVYVPVQPVAPVRRVTRDDGQDFKSDQDTGAPPSQRATPVAELRKARSDVMEELSGSQEKASSTRFFGLDRDQLASIIYDRSGAYTVAERASVKQLVDQNDQAYLGRARELSDISGDERVYLDAKIALEKSKSAVERAVPDDQQVDIASLERARDDLNKDVGAPVGITLSYPNGLQSIDAPRLPLPNRDDAINVSAGATRAALVYRAAGL